MSERIAALARRVEGDRFFLASALKAYRESENVSEETLANQLGCARESLPLVALCRRPAVTPPRFGRDVRRIAERYGLDALALARVIRHADAVLALRRSSIEETGLLMAARDREPEPESDVPDADDPR